MPIRIQHEDFDPGDEIAQLHASNSRIGAVVSFVGMMRDFNEGESVSQMELEHYPGMTEKALERIMAAAQARWNILDASVIHRIGTLKPTDRIVLVAVAAEHRGEAFAACEFIIDYLKTEAPFWKKEVTGEGARWVEARVADDRARARWNEHSGSAGSAS